MPYPQPTVCSNILHKPKASSTINWIGLPKKAKVTSACHMAGEESNGIILMKRNLKQEDITHTARRQKETPAIEG
jgi:hypothetical protein